VLDLPTKYTLILLALPLLLGVMVLDKVK